MRAILLCFPSKTRPGMNSGMIFLCFFLKYVIANVISNRIVVDYFDHKKSSRVTGFSCNFIEDDVQLLKDLNEKSMTAALYKSNDATNIQNIGNTSYWRLGIFVDTRCYDTTREITSLFLRASDQRMFDELRHWLILGSNLDEILNYVDDRAFGLSTDFVIAVLGANDSYVLYDLYNPFKARGGTLNITFFGSWHSESKFSVSLTQSKYHRRANLHGMAFSAMFYKPSYKPPGMSLEEYYEDYLHATKDGQSKFGYHVLSHISDMYNFSLRLSESEKWDVTDRMGPIVRALMNSSTDFTGTPIGLNVPRTFIMKFVHQDWPFRLCFMFRNPQPTDIKFQEIFRPFTDEIWYLMILLLMGNVIVLALALRYDSQDQQRSMNYSNSLLINVGAICQQCTDLRMDRISTRIGFLFIMLYSLLMYNYYSASVVSARLDEPIYKINDSLSELAKLNLKLASEQMVYLEFFLRRPETQYFYNNSWLKVPESERYIVPEIGVRLMKQGGYAYHTHPEVAYEFMERLFDNREICEVMEVHVARPFHTTFGVTFNSTIVEIARVGLTRVAETGLKRRQLHRWQHRKPKCRSDILRASSIDIYEFAAHLIILVIGILLAVIIFLVEVMISRRNCSISSKLNDIKKHLSARGMFIKCNSSKIF